MIRDKTVFVTGADGFIGSHLIEMLVLKGYKVKALVNYNSWGSNGWLGEIDTNLIKEVELLYGDIRDPDAMLKYIQNSNYVLHLASLIAIPYSYISPRSYIQTNVEGSHNIFNACLRSKKIEKIIHMSTSEVYGTAQYTPIDEKHPLVGQSPYAASKISADKFAESYHLSFELPLIIGRAFNTYGPRQTSRAIIPTILSQLVFNKNFVKLGNVDATRDFNYVTDTISGLHELMLLDNCFGEVFNIGSGKEISILEIVKLMSKNLGYDIEIINDKNRYRPNGSEVDRLLADNSKIKENTGWVPKVDFNSGLMKTYEWIKSNIKYFKKDAYDV